MNKDFALFGNVLYGDKITQAKNGVLAERFEFPPFTVLNAREGLWQERKTAWIGLGIKSEIGRSAHAFNTEDWFAAKGLSGAEKGNTSIFDPVLCELMYRWFCPPGGQVVDPFAGGSVRGLVAGLLGFRYHGIDLNAGQIAANVEQRAAITKDAPIEWRCGDSLEFIEQAPPADFVFTCPPYGDLERYSDDPRDLSTMEYHTFIANFGRIILKCAKTLKDNRFACIVVGDFRDKRTGFYRGFVADTVKAFQAAGMALYNEAILLTAIGSLPIRVGKQFMATRKLGKAHQNILVFIKGKPDVGDWNK